MEASENLDLKRGNAYSSLCQRQNLILIWGCRPAHGVKADTNMVSELAKVMTERFDRDNLALRIPDAFEQLKSEDANFEMVTSNLLQPLQMHFHDNIITDKCQTAFIFVNTHCQNLPWKNAAKRGQDAFNLFKTVFQFENV